MKHTAVSVKSHTKDIVLTITQYFLRPSEPFSGLSIERMGFSWNSTFCLLDTENCITEIIPRVNKHFLKQPDSKHFQLWAMKSIRHDYLSLPLSHKSSHRQ
jgi:hypothetical protein